MKAAARMPKKLARTIEKIRARDPGAVPGPPDGAERVDAAAKCLGRPLPADYAAFLAHVGRITWPREIGNLVDHRKPHMEPRFAPFSPAVEGWCDGFVRDRPAAHQLATLEAREDDLRESRAHRKELVASGEGEQRDDQSAYVAQLDEEIDEVRAQASELRKTPRQPAHLAIDSYCLETDRLSSVDDRSAWGWSDPVPLRATDDGPQRIAFADWLARIVDEALADEETERKRPEREAAEREAERRAAAEELPERARRRARALEGARNIVAWLRESEKLDVASDFDAEAAATALVPRVVERWMDGVLDALAERDDVIEVFAATDELEAMWSKLVPAGD